ncbi:hypothetical protein L4D09_26505 [Photobacterium makurazakiensis]|uniref:hypothetical protein n=1 Tax=Photobacterium makurazakiensis TaxID=2910234 RepID=UPI003D0EF8C6
MKPTFYIFFCLSIFNFTAMANDDTSQAADDVCQCLQEPYQQAELVISAFSEAQQSGDLSTVTQTQDQLMNIINTAELCMERLQIKYPEINKDQAQQEKVMLLTDELCPNPLNKYRQ